jgi:hypothetical protein
VKPNPNALPAHIIDLAPTILWLLEQAVPEEMDGSVLQDALTFSEKLNTVTFSDSKSKPDTTPCRSQYSKEEEAIKKRLESLGYLD